MSLQPSFNRFIKSLQEYLTGYGFESDGRRVFRRYSSAGDALIIELQTSAGSDKSERLFYINVALVLAPSWEFDKRRYGLPASERPRHLYGVWKHRIGLNGFSGSDRWRIDGEATSALVTEQVRRRLDEVLPELFQLLDRDKLQQLAEEGAFLGWAAWQVRAWLLAERGNSRELEGLLFKQRPAETHNSALTQGIWNYANIRAADGSCDR